MTIKNGNCFINVFKTNADCVENCGILRFHIIKDGVDYILKEYKNDGFIVKTHRDMGKLIEINITVRQALEELNIVF